MSKYCCKKYLSSTNVLSNLIVIQKLYHCLVNWFYSIYFLSQVKHISLVPFYIREKITSCWQSLFKNNVRNNLVANLGLCWVYKIIYFLIFVKDTAKSMCIENSIKIRIHPNIPYHLFPTHFYNILSHNWITLGIFIVQL